MLAPTINVIAYFYAATLIVGAIVYGYEKGYINMSKKWYNTISRLASLKYENKISGIEPIFLFEAIMFLEIGKYYGYISADINEKFI